MHVNPVPFTFSTFFNVIFLLFHTSSGFLLPLSFYFLSLLPYAASAAAPSVQGFSLFSIYSNGLHDVMKTNVIKQYVSASLPHVWIVNETRSSTPVASRVFVSASGYNIFECTALRTSPRSSKWGVIAAVCRDLQLIPVPDGLALCHYPRHRHPYIIGEGVCLTSDCRLVCSLGSK